MKGIKVIVPGGLNTDIIGLGVDTLLGPGELTLGGTLEIGPGGKARNMAQMAAGYLGRNKVAMIGRTSMDPYGLWKAPFNALQQAGVNTAHVRKMNFKEAKGVFPGIALIPVDKKGRNQIYVLPGVNAGFGKADIDNARALFTNRSGNKVMVMALEIPLPAVKYAIDTAYRNTIKVVLDPGGISGPVPGLVNKKIFLLKPNEHEAKLISGVTISGFPSARKAAARIRKRGVSNVMITHGAKGAYLFTGDKAVHLKVPKVKKGRACDETGCGDQVTSVLASCLAEGRDVEEAARLAVLAGTLQFNRAGIKPVSRRELLHFIR